MPSSPTSPSRFHSSISLALLLLLAPASACDGEESCGVGDAPATGLVASATGVSLTLADVRVIDLTGTADGCTYDFESTQPAPTGTVTATGVCANGTDPAGFALTIDGTITVKRTCGATVDAVALALAGTVAVTSRD